jgi:hypothetical protein
MPRRFIEGTVVMGAAAGIAATGEPIADGASGGATADAMGAATAVTGVADMAATADMRE